MAGQPPVAVFALAAAIAVSACGFRPVYGDGPNGAVSADLGAVMVEPIPDRLGQLVRNNLVDRLAIGPERAARYRLSIAIEPEVEGFGFRSDDRAVTRERMILRARFEMRMIETGEVVLAQDTSASMSYDVVQSDFATFSATRDAERRLAEQIADDVAARLALYFQQAQPG